MNYFSSPTEYFVSSIALNKKISNNDILGINCFNELILKNEFEILFNGNKSFIDQLKNDLIFFSKRLNLYVINNDKEIKV